MIHPLRHTALVLLTLALPAAASAGSGPCSDGCAQVGDYCCPQPGCRTCVPECRTVKETRHCWCTECEEICIPPVQLPCCRCLFGGAAANGCNAGGGCCESGCTGCPSCCQRDCCKDGLLQRLFRRCAGCRTRCVKVLKKHEYDCQTTDVEWKVQCCGTGGCCDTGACCAPQ